jgi:hypothetical protein
MKQWEQRNSFARACARERDVGWQRVVGAGLLVRFLGRRLVLLLLLLLVWVY